MKIYHLNIKDESDSRFDMNFFYTHGDESKTYIDLEKDYVSAYEYIHESSDDYTLEDILSKIDSYGWKNINVETAYVRL